MLISMVGLVWDDSFIEVCSMVVKRNSRLAPRTVCDAGESKSTHQPWLLLRGTKEKARRGSGRRGVVACDLVVAT